MWQLINTIVPLGLSYDPDFDDSDTCWHGRTYSDCNRGRLTVSGGCKWWHFFPDEDLKTHLTVFNEITSHELKDFVENLLD